MLRDRWKLRTKLTTLDAADFAFRGNGPKGEVQVGVERKTIGDLVGSMMSARLGAIQLPKLLQDYDHVWLVVEGWWRPGLDDQIEVNVIRNQRDYASTYLKWMPSRFSLTYSQLDRYLCSLEVMGTVHVRRTADPLETCAFLADAYHWWQKAWKQHHSHDVVQKMAVPAKVLTRKLTQLRKTAASLPTLGAEQSRLAEAYFGSIVEMVCADENQWRRAGLGMADARKIVRAVRETYHNGPRPK